MVLLSVHFGNRKPNLCPSCMPLFLSVFILLPFLCFCSSFRHVVSCFKHFTSKVFGVLPISHFLTISFPNSLFLLTSAFQADLGIYCASLQCQQGCQIGSPRFRFTVRSHRSYFSWSKEIIPALLTDTVLELPSVTGSSRLPSLEGNVRHVSA